MYQSEPTIYDMTLQIGDELGHDDAPDCCGAEMTRGKDKFGDLVYTCNGCRTELEVDSGGLVFDIREKAAA